MYSYLHHLNVAARRRSVQRRTRSIITRVRVDRVTLQKTVEYLGLAGSVVSTAVSTIADVLERRCVFDVALGTAGIRVDPSMIQE